MTSMDYDSWKTTDTNYERASARQAELDDICAGIEDNMDRILSASVALVNQMSLCQFSASVDVNATDTGPFASVNLRLYQVPADKSTKQTAEEIAGCLEDLAKQVRECARH